MKKQIQTSGAPSADHILSQGLVVGKTFYVCGQVHVLPDNTLVEGSVASKLERIMKNIEAILNAGNAKLDDIVKVIIYVTDMAIMPELNEEYPKYFTKPYPVREAVCVSALPLGANIEISVVAMTEKGEK